MSVKSRSHVGCLLCALLLMVGCSDTQEDFRRDVPPGVEAEKVMFSRTDWFHCSVAVLELKKEFAAHLREGEAKFLRKATSSALAAYERQLLQDVKPARPLPEFGDWKPTPLNSTGSDEIQLRNREATRECLNAAPFYANIYDEFLSESGGFFAESNFGGTVMIEPGRGLLFIGGYE